MLKTFIKYIGGFLAATVAILLVASLILHLGQRRGAPVAGLTAAVVVSGSMSGAIEVDDLIISKAQESYSPGEVILFETPEGSLVTHRIVAENADGSFTTQGDANNTADAWPVPASAILGRVTHAIPKVGVAVGFFQSPLGLSLIGAAILGLLLSLFWPRKKQEVPYASQDR